VSLIVHISNHFQLADFLKVIIMDLSFAIFTILFFTLNLLTKNNKLISIFQKFNNKILYRKNFWRVMILLLIISILFIFIPIKIKTIKVSKDRNIQSIGIWTYGKPFDLENGEEYYMDNETLQFLSSKNIYFIWGGINRNKLNTYLISNFTNFKNLGIKLHIWISPIEKNLSFFNLWSFENLTNEIKFILSYFDNFSLIGDPITTIVYDMEGIPDAYFPLYGMNSFILSKIKEYYEVQKKFIEFNQWIHENYNLNIRICTDIYQAYDLIDGDSDLISIWGLFNDYHTYTDYSFMIYRRNNMGLNYILDSLNLIDTNSTIILNSWKEKDHFCWNDLNCALNEAKLVLDYPKKQFNLEIWCLYYFLKSFKISGLIKFINSIFSNDENYLQIEIRNQFPYSFYSDLLLIGIGYLEKFSSLFRLLYLFY